MHNDVWVKVDNYLDRLQKEDRVLTAVRKKMQAENLPDISVSLEQGRFLTVLAKSVRARYILEIGTLGGFSAVCLARALPHDGHLITLESDETHARVARENFAEANLADKATVMLGSALSSLPKLAGEYEQGFDFIFIDADKETYPDYWSWALRLSHPGTLIVADNVVREGAVADESDSAPEVEGAREYLKLAAAESTVITSTLQTVGLKGHDGFAVTVVCGDTKN